ncbi:MAG: hypothetical protein AB8G96_11615 [Phycisphaerales bacterium]
MKSTRLDKIASVTRTCCLPPEVKLSNEFPCQEGDVVAVRIQTHKTTYNQLELTTGRFSTLRPGDVVAGALGHRFALRGYAGTLPTSLAAGESIDLLNLGGVLGCCTSTSPDLGAPFSCEVLGQILHFPYLGERIGVPASIRTAAKPCVAEDASIDLGGVPVIAIAGTSMHAGKTCAAALVIQELRRRGLVIDAAKATGVSLRRDILTMEDAGARHISTFTDYGVVTTAEANAPTLTRSMLGGLAQEKPDAIMLEMGDGLFGTYGVGSVLHAPDIREALSAVILCANDPVGAWGGVKHLRESCGIEPTVVTGPATDNAAGTEVIERLTGVPAINARVHAELLTQRILEAIGRSEPPQVSVMPSTAGAPVATS